MTYIERPTSLISKPPLPSNKPRAKQRGEQRIYGNLNQRVKLFEGLGQLSEDASESGEESENLEPLRRHQPKVITPEHKRWTQIDRTDSNTQEWGTSCKSPTKHGGSLRSPVPAPRKSLVSPTSPNGVLPSPTYARSSKSVFKFKPIPKPRVRSVAPDFLLDKDFVSETGGEPTSPRLTPTPPRITPTSPQPSPTSPTRPSPVLHRKTSVDSVIYMNKQKMAYYYTVHPPSESEDRDRPRAQTSTGNRFTIEEDSSGATHHRPRSRSDFDNGRTKEEQAQVRQSVMEIAQAFGGLNTGGAGGNKDRPKTFGYPLSNGHGNKKLMNSSPNLLDDGYEPVELKSSAQKLMNSSPDLLEDHSYDGKEQHEIKYGKHNHRLSKALAGLNPVQMPPSVDSNANNKNDNFKSKARPPRPKSVVPPKPKRTYEQDVYARNKNVQSAAKGRSKVDITQTMSSAARIGMAISPMMLPSSMNPKKRHVYDDVPVPGEAIAEDKESPQTSPVAPKSHVWPPPTNKPTDRHDYDDDKTSTNSPSEDDKDAKVLSRRGRLQRSKRVERSRSIEDLHSSFKISGEYALPESVVNIRNRNGESKRKSEYSEVYVARSSSEESIFKKVHDPVEDEQGYSVPGSHLWSEAAPQKEEPAANKTGIKLTAIQNVVSVMLLMWQCLS